LTFLPPTRTGWTFSWKPFLRSHDLLVVPRQRNISQAWAGEYSFHGVLGPCCRLFDREEAALAPGCRLAWRDKERGRAGRRIEAPSWPDLARVRMPVTTTVDIYTLQLGAQTEHRTVLTLPSRSGLKRQPAGVVGTASNPVSLDPGNKPGHSTDGSGSRAAVAKAPGDGLAQRNPKPLLSSFGERVSTAAAAGIRGSLGSQKYDHCRPPPTGCR